MVKKSHIYILILIMVLFGILYIILTNDPIKNQINEVKKNPPKIPQINENVIKDLNIEDNLGDIQSISDEQLTLEQIIALLRKHYGKNIINKWVQIRLIEDLIRMLKEKYPNSWVTELYVLLKLSFPNLADEIFKRFEEYQEYQTWLDKERDSLMSLSPEERQKILWDKRYEIFGREIANEIWASELKSQQLQQSLKQIDVLSGDIQEKAKQFKASLYQIYGDETQDFIKKRNFDLSQTFLQLSSVQKELQNMDSDSRYKTLKQIRIYLGMEPEAVKRLEDLEKERDIRWEIGKQYLTEREQLIQKGASEEELHKLRLKFFNPEMAEIIKQEEESGFFRFKEQRIYGIN